jgi:hypothetical protein
MRIKTIMNISEVQVPLILVDGTTMYLPPKGTVENIDIMNYFSINKYVKAVVEVREVPQHGVGTQYLKS